MDGHFEGDLLPPTFFQCCSESIWISFGTQKEETREEGCTVHKIKFQNDHDELNSLELCGPFTARRSVIIVIYDCSVVDRHRGDYRLSAPVQPGQLRLDSNEARTGHGDSLCHGRGSNKPRTRLEQDHSLIGHGHGRLHAQRDAGGRAPPEVV
jgi:hypothetical protein